MLNISLAVNTLRINSLLYISFTLDEYEVLCRRGPGFGPDGSGPDGGFITGNGHVG